MTPSCILWRSESRRKCASFYPEGTEAQDGNALPRNSKSNRLKASITTHPAVFFVVLRDYESNLASKAVPARNVFPLLGVRIMTKRTHHSLWFHNKAFFLFWSYHFYSSICWHGDRKNSASDTLKFEVLYIQSTEHEMSRKGNCLYINTALYPNTETSIVICVSDTDRNINIWILRR